MLEEYLDYDPETGVVRWIKSKGRNCKSGAVAGTLNSGYLRVKFDGKHYPIHRLAWYLYHGTWPKGQIDHINRDKLDNRIENLRDVSSRANSQNTNSFNYGSIFYKGKWRVGYMVGNKKIHVGSFDDEQQAREAYLSAIEQLGTNAQQT